MAEQEKKTGFFDKAKALASKFGKGAKDVAVKTARRNSPSFLGSAIGIGNINAEKDHAVIYAINMEDIVFKAENVVSSEFTGAFGNSVKSGKGTIPTVKYDLRLDNNVVFPDALKTDTSVLHIDVLITKDHAHYFGEGKYMDAQKNLFEGSVYVYKHMTVFVWKRITDPNNGMYTLETIVLPHAQLNTASCQSTASFSYATGAFLSFNTKKADKLLEIEEIRNKA